MKNNSLNKAINIIAIFSSFFTFFYLPLVALVILTSLVLYDLFQIQQLYKQMKNDLSLDKQILKSELSKNVIAIENQEAQLNAFLNNINSPVFFITKSNRISYYNSALENTFKIKISTSYDYANILPKDLLQYIDDAQFSESPIELQIKLYGKYYIFSSNPVRNKEKYFLGNIFLLNDVTSIEQSKQAQKQFIAYASHELKTPIATINGAADILSTHSDIATDDKQMFLDMIHVETQKMNTLVSDLLELSKFESQTYKLSRSYIGLYQLISEVLASLRYLANTKNITFIISPTNIYVYVDIFRMNQVFTNILINAINFSNTDSNINIAFTDDIEYISITIIDYGIGISRENIHKVFDPFFTIPHPSEKKYTGTGLGLSITQSILSLHNSYISIESIPKNKTTVTIQLSKKYNTIKKEHLS